MTKKFFITALLTSLLSSNLLSENVEEIIVLEQLPIEKIIISKIFDEIWENRFEVYLLFNNQSEFKFIKESLTKLENSYLNWPIHERPKKLIVLDRKDSFALIKGNEVRGWKDIGTI